MTRNNMECYLRKADCSDCDLLYEWANNPDVRQNAFNSEHISYDTHCKWFEKIMSDCNTLQYILMQNDTPLGQVRLTINNDEAEIDYSIDSSKRGEGYGKRILALVSSEIAQNHTQITRLIGRVKENNTASKHCFEANGFEKVFVQYELDLREKNNV